MLNADLELIEAAIQALQPLVEKGNPRAVEVMLLALERRAEAVKVTGTDGTIRDAANLTIQALRAGRLELIDSARVAALEVLADAVDADPSNASLWREYRTAEIALREVDEVDSDDFNTLLDEVRTTLGDPKKP